jgi:hypothetical protein
MTPPDDRVRIRHMRDAVEKALRYTQDSSRQGLADDEILRLAVTKLVEIVGEAAKQVSEPDTQRPPVGAVVGRGTDARPAHTPLLRRRPRRAVATITELPAAARRAARRPPRADADR